MNPTIDDNNRRSKYNNRRIPSNKANKERVLEDAEDDDDDSDHEPMTLHLPDGNDSNDSDVLVLLRVRNSTGTPECTSRDVQVAMYK